MNIAFIPVRGGSKSIPLKNIKIINGKPLVYWTVRAACGCKYIDKVYIVTDSTKIKETVETFQYGSEKDFFKKVKVVGRSAESATDTASTEFAMLEFTKRHDFENIVLIQATSPLLLSSDLDQGFEVLLEEEVDSVISVVREKRFYWTYDKKGFVHPQNYDVFKRPRRQDFDGYMVENGAFYITSRESLMNTGNRISGNIKAVEMNPDTAFEIDEPSDWIIIESLMKNNKITVGGLGSIMKPLPEIKMFLTDCDGCLTDGGMYYSEHGDEMKKFNTRDGMGFARLQQMGVITGIITSENVSLNRRRAEKLKLDILESGCKDKAEVIREYCRQYDVALDNVCYIGDDINDLEAIKIVGLGCCPSDAIMAVREVADYITCCKGGEGVIREVVEIMCIPTL